MAFTVVDSITNYKQMWFHDGLSVAFHDGKLRDIYIAIRIHDLITIALIVIFIYWFWFLQHVQPIPTLIGRHSSSVRKIFWKLFPTVINFSGSRERIVKANEQKYAAKDSVVNDGSREEKTNPLWICI